MQFEDPFNFWRDMVLNWKLKNGTTHWLRRTKENKTKKGISLNVRKLDKKLEKLRNKVLHVA